MAADINQWPEATAAPLTPGSLEARISFFRAAAAAASTRRAYLSDLKQYARWGGFLPGWAEAPRRLDGAEAPGTPPAEVERYLADHGERLKISTLRRRVAALNRWNKANHCPPPGHSEAVGQMLAGIARAQAHAEDPALRARMRTKRAAPLLRDHLFALIESLNPTRPRDCRDRALFLTAWALAGRRSEINTLRLADLAFDGDGVDIHLGITKTDQEGLGTVLGVPAVGGALCPVAALRAWLKEAEIREGWVFRAVDRWGHISPNALHCDSLTQILRERLQAAGVTGVTAFSSHSFRAGLITQAVGSGANQACVRQHSRHKSQAVFDRYVRLVPDKSVSFLHGVLGPQGNSSEDADP